jgi:hypothetical protein
MEDPAGPSVKVWAAMVLGVALLGGGCGNVHTAAEFVPHPVEWPREVRSPADLSSLLDAPFFFRSAGAPVPPRRLVFDGPVFEARVN